MSINNGLIILLLLLSANIGVAKSFNNNVSDQSQSSNKMKQFLSSIIQDNSKKNSRFLLITLNEIETEFLDYTTKILQNEGISVTILNFNTNNKKLDAELSDNYFSIILLDPDNNHSTVEEFFKPIKPSRAKILVVLTKKPSPAFTRQLIKIFEEIQTLNVLIAYDNQTKIKLITLNLFLRFSDSMSFATKYLDDKPKNLKNSQINAFLAYSDRTKLKTVKNPKDGTYEYSGKDYNTMQAIFSHLHLNLNVIHWENTLKPNTTSPFHESVPILNRTEVKKQIVKSNNISLLIKSEQFNENDEIFEHTYPHIQNDLRAIIPKSSEMPFTERYSKICTLDVWSFYILMPVVLGIVWELIRKLIFHRKRSVYFSLIRITITTATDRFPESPLERFLLLSWILYSFIINICLQSKTFSILSVKLYESEINTIEELIQSNVKIFAFPSRINEVKMKYAGTKYQSFADGILPFPGIYEGNMDLVTYTIKSDDKTIPIIPFLGENDIAVFVARACRRKDRPIFHIVAESIIPYYQSFKISYGSPLLPIVNKHLRRLEEGGFIKFWAEEHVRQATIEGLLYHEDIDSDTATHFQAISVNSCMIIIILWIIGAFVAILMFLFELIWKEIQEKLTSA